MRLARATAIAGWVLVGGVATYDLVVGIPDECGTVPIPRPLPFGPTPVPWVYGVAVLALSVLGILGTFAATRGGRVGGVAAALGWVVAGAMGAGGFVSIPDGCGTFPRPIPSPFDPTPDPWWPGALVLTLSVVGLAVSLVARRVSRRTM